MESEEELTFVIDADYEHRDGLRTRVTLDPDVAAELRALMRERGITFMEATNQTLRRGLGQRRKALPYVVPTHDLGLRPGVDLAKALRLGSELEDWTSMRGR